MVLPESCAAGKQLPCMGGELEAGKGRRAAWTGFMSPSHVGQQSPSVRVLTLSSQTQGLPGDGVSDWTPAVLLQEMPCSTQRRNPQAKVGCPMQGVQAYWYGSGAHRIGEGKDRGATQAKKCQKPAPGEAEVCSLLKPRA